MEPNAKNKSIQKYKLNKEASSRKKEEKKRENQSK